MLKAFIYKGIKSAKVVGGLEIHFGGFEQSNGHKEYKKLNSEFKAAISMYRKNQKTVQVL